MSQYTFDSLGTNPANRIANEPHKLGITNGVDCAIWYPKAAPFYAETMVVVDANTGKTLVPGVDYVLGHKWEKGSKHIGRTLCGSVIIRDPTKSTMDGLLTYQTVGGEAVINLTGILVDAMLALAQVDTTVDWSMIANVPATLPAASHFHALTGVDGISDIITAIRGLSETFRVMPKQIVLDDIVDIKPKFITPLLNKVTELSTNIKTLALQTQIYTVISKSDDVTVALPTIKLKKSRYVGTGVSVSLDNPGLYRIDVFPGFLIKNGAKVLPYKWRLIDSVTSTPIPDSTSTNVVMLNITKAMTIELEYYTDTLPTSVLPHGEKVSTVTAMLIQPIAVGG